MGLTRELVVDFFRSRWEQRNVITLRRATSCPRRSPVSPALFLLLHAKLAESADENVFVVLKFVFISSSSSSKSSAERFWES
jgi:hypothetical protein